MLMSVEDVLDSAPRSCEDIVSLYNWSTNFQAGEGPFALFLDLIGWSEDNIGETLFAKPEVSFASRLGCIELSRLGEALTAYADLPFTVGEFVDRLMDAESEE
jgi:hypothetical protein